MKLLLGTLATLILQSSYALFAAGPVTDPPNIFSGTGTMSAASLAIDRIESINALNGNVNLRIPISHLPPGPAGFSAGIDLIYNSALFDLQTNVPDNNGNVLEMDYVPSKHGGGWNYGYKYTLWSQTRTTLFSTKTCSAVSSVEAQNWYKTIFTTPDGSNHVLRLISGTNASNNAVALSSLTSDPSASYDIYDFAGFTNLNCTLNIPRFQGKLVYVSSDSSYIRVEVDTQNLKWVAFFADGMKVSGSTVLTSQPHATDSDANLMTDRHGNQIQVIGSCMIGTACTEQLSDAYGNGRTNTITYTSNAANSWTDQISWTGPNGLVSATINWESGTANALPYYCRVSPNGQTDTTTKCHITQHDSRISSVQMPAGVAGGVAVAYQMAYALPTLKYTWGELHSVTMCSTNSTSVCQPQWNVQYTYRFDTDATLISDVQNGLDNPTSARAPGIALNPITSKTLSYSSTLLTNSTPVAETTQFYMLVPTDIYSYPAASSNGPTNSAAEVLYPDGSYVSTYTYPSCPGSQKLRDLCVQLPYSTVNRDTSISEYFWALNSAPAGTPAGAPFNQYVQWRSDKAPGSSLYKLVGTQQDANGNTLSSSECDWATSASHDQNGYLSAQSCTSLRTTSSSFLWPTDQYWLTSAHSFLRAPSSITTGARQTAFQYAANNIDLTGVSISDTALSSTLNQTSNYLANGNISSQTVAGVQTLTCYDNQSLYPVMRVTGAASNATCSSPTAPAPARTTSFVYDQNTGLLSSTTDGNNNVTDTFQYDNLGRTKLVTETAQIQGASFTRKSATVYDDLNLTTTVTQDDSRNGTATTITAVTAYDALGRVSFVQDAAGSMIQKAYRFGALSNTANQQLNYELTSNPHIATSESTMGWQLTTRDPLGRVLSVKSFSGQEPPAVASIQGPQWGTNATVTGSSQFAYDITGTSCNGRANKVTDGAALTMTNCYDVFGRLQSVTEPDSSVTTYAYDTLNNPTRVAGPSGTRGFIFDAIGRLRVACNPEGTTADCSQTTVPQAGDDRYFYDANGNLTSRTDARGTTTTISGFDALNRPSTMSYSDGITAPVSFVYDQGYRGALSSTSKTIGTSVYTNSYTYDALGRVTGSTQATAGVSYPFSYKYSVGNRLEQMTYPSGRIVKYGADSAGRVASVQNGTANTNYATLAYNGMGQISSMTMGNNLVENYTWNDRSQFVKLDAGTKLTLNLYPCSGTLVACSSGNNGLVQSQRIQGSGLDVTQTYGYDSGNRLTAVAEGSLWSEAYQYTDPSNRLTGNRWVSARSGLPGLTSQTPQSANWFLANNRVNGWTYDSAGNLTSVVGTSRTFTYDGENRMLTAAVNGVNAGYVYDGDGQRVQKTVGTVTTTYVYDASGNLSAEYTVGAATPNPCGTLTCYVTVDHLGSTRMVTDSNGNVAARYDYLPFGQELLAGTGGRTTGQGFSGTPDAFDMKYTGQVRDPETQLDYMNARYYDPAQGRFQAMDPGNAGADPGSPQTWNGFAYVNNSPLNAVDPSGMGVGEGAAAGGLVCGGPCAAIGAAVELGIGLWELFGGGGHKPSLANFPFPDQSSTTNGQPWNEQLPSGVGSGGALGTGGVFGSGEVGPFVFSLQEQSPTGFSLGWSWLRGILPAQIYYPGSHPGTQAMKRSGIVQSLRKSYIDAGCPAFFSVASGHLGPWKESAQNGIIGNTTQFQVGGFNGIFATGKDGAISSFTLFNTVGWSSLTGESTWGPKVGLRGNALDTQRGLGHNVLQTFSWSEPNPCHQ